MSALLQYTTKIESLATYSEIIDVRSPGEFAEDCIPGAINLPVLNNEERARVGTLYKQVSPFAARKLGAALVSKNIGEHLLTALADKEKDYHPLIYCWRGGQRSRSLAVVLSEIGWCVTLLEGGYRTYRAYVRSQLEHLPQRFDYRILCGATGTGKTRILRSMQARGLQVLDLEGLANHRGSLLGQEWAGHLTPQPSQKFFESFLLRTLQAFDPSRVVWVESESNKIGQVYLPTSLWDCLKRSPAVEVQLPLSERVAWLLNQYPHFTENPELLKEKLVMLKSRHGWDKVQHWFRAIDAGQWAYLVRDLVQTHYDPSYYRSLPKHYPNVERVVSLPNLSEASVVHLIEQLTEGEQREESAGIVPTLQATSRS